MYFHEFSKILNELEQESSRNSMTEKLASLLKKLDPEEVAPALYLMNGRVGPRYDALEFNMSTKMVVKVANKISGKKDMSGRYKELGDTGLLLEEVTKSNPKSKHNIKEVFDNLKVIAKYSGTGSVETKINALSALMKELDPLSNRYIARIVVGKVRLGFNDKTVLDATSWCLSGDKTLRNELERAYGVRSDIGLIVKIALKEGIDVLKDMGIEPGIPVASKLVEREKDTQSIFDRHDIVIVQPKYDGLRAQIHFDSNGIDVEDGDEPVQTLLTEQEKIKVRIYSRNMEDMTHMFPDIVQKLSKIKKGSFVLDSEIIGYDEETETFHSFQDTISRKRKHGIKDKAAEIPVRVFAFDLLFLDGDDITQLGTIERIAKLEELVVKLSMNEIVLTETEEMKTADDLENKFMEYINSGLEGIIAKDGDSLYKPGTRNYDWIKLKASSKKGFVDTVDAVVLGYYKGRGARAKFGIGALLVGIYDDEKDKFATIAKIGTGVTDEQWELILSELKEIIVKEKPKNVEVDKTLEPDIWVSPEIVMEVEADEITMSKVHTAGKDKSESKGFSLRFPRMKIFRKDKSARQATTVKEIKKMVKLKKEKFSK